MFIAPGDTLLLTFGKEYNLEEVGTIAKRIAEVLPENKIIVNLEGLMTDIKIIKEEPQFPTILNGGDYNSTGKSAQGLEWTTTSNTKEFKLNDYIY